MHCVLAAWLVIATAGAGSRQLRSFSQWALPCRHAMHVWLIRLPQGPVR